MGLFSILAEAVKSSDVAIVGASTEMILSTLNHDASLVRSYIINESNASEGLLPSLIHGLLHYQVLTLSKPYTLNPTP